MIIRIPDLEALPNAARALLDHLGDRRKIGLQGEIGAGKTTLTQELCRQLGVEQKVLSPTFSLVNQYTYRDAAGKEQLVHHLDLYRLPNIDEALDIGVEDYLYDPHYCIVEWYEAVEPLLPADAVRISLEIMPDSSRKLVVL